MSGHFGLTTLGHSDPIKDANIISDGYMFHELEEEEYTYAFGRFLLGATSQVAATLEVDGNSTVLRASLGDMLKVVLNRQPRKFELDAWFTQLDFDRSATLGVEEYMKAVRQLRELSAAPQQPREYTSFDHRRCDWQRHVRVGYEPQNTLRTPLTTQQEVGWHAPKQAPPRTSFATNHTDVTIKEGRDAKHYYGHFNC